MSNMPLLLYHSDSIENDIEIRAITITERSNELHIVITFKQEYDLTNFKKGDNIEIVSGNGNIEYRYATIYNIQMNGILESVGKDYIIIKPMNLNK